MLFSIIIPTYNRSRFLKRLLSQILNQGFNDLEVVIVDDGSTDNTREFILSISDPRLQYCYIENSERGAARNYGLKVSSGDYVNFFDSDDLFLPCLHSLADFVTAKNFPQVVYGDIQHEDEKGNAICTNRPPYQSFTKNLLHNNFLACGSVFIKKEIAMHFPFHEDRRLSSAEDWELWLRIHTQYVFTHYPLFIFKQIHHSTRSLTLISADKIETRDNYFVQLVNQDSDLINFYGTKAIKLFEADRYTFISLSWFGSDKQKVIFYWMKAFHTSIYVIKRRRFWAILKKLILPK